MKKLLVVGLISSFVSAGAFAAACSATLTAVTQQGASTSAGGAGVEQCVCNGGTAAKFTVNGGAGQVIEVPIFAKSGFDAQCSANTVVSFKEISGTAAAVAGGSRKGNQAFKGSTAGGGIALNAACASNNGCIGTDVTTAMTAATTDAGS